ncbi:MAG: dihydropteroate synthase [Nitriliruptorales bacterium]|nr:dihydropteroate synthase [Nitriliruptorales bacterium]
MGIVNTGADSFSDVGAPSTVEGQVQLGLELVEAGAAVIDVGAESGVTYNRPSSVDDQVRRLVPVVGGLAERGVVVSVDTYDVRVAEAALDAGAVLVNDVSGLIDPEMADLCAERGAGLVVMHTRARPKEEHFPHYDDVVADCEEFLQERMELAISRGVPVERLVLDPGFDYAKTPVETVELVQALPVLRRLGRPLLLGVSRKYFLGAITGQPPDRRDAETLAAVGWVRPHAALLRVHDVAAARRYLHVIDVLAGRLAMPQVDRDDERLKWVRAGD